MSSFLSYCCPGFLCGLSVLPIGSPLALLLPILGSGVLCFSEEFFVHKWPRNLSCDSGDFSSLDQMKYCAVLLFPASLFVLAQQKSLRSGIGVISLCCGPIPAFYAFLRGQHLAGSLCDLFLPSDSSASAITCSFGAVNLKTCKLEVVG